MSDLEKERLKENQPEKAVLEKLQDVPIKGLKSVFLGVKSPQIVRGISKSRYISHHDRWDNLQMYCKLGQVYLS